MSIITKKSKIKVCIEYPVSRIHNTSLTCGCLECGAGTSWFITLLLEP
jgi:hypothetical protein